MASNFCVSFLFTDPAALNSLNFQDKGPQVPWTRSKQTLVCCLYRFFHRDNDAFKKVFTSIFKNDLSHFNGDVPFNRLSSQWADLRRKGDPIWYEVIIETPFPPEGPWLAVVARTKEQATAIGVSLVEKDEDDIDTTGFRLDPSRRSRDRPTPLNPPQAVVTPASVRTVEMRSSLPPQPATVARPTGSEPLCTAGGKVCYWCCQEAAEVSDEKCMQKPYDLVIMDSNI